jgi:hypothetical protein
MHDHAEHRRGRALGLQGGGAKGYAGCRPAANTTPRSRCCASCWPGSATCQVPRAQGGVFDDRIYVLTPNAAIVELPQGATAVDFAYSVHTNLGHRCRGARVDGAMVPLNTPLKNGQTVEVTPSRRGARRATGSTRSWVSWPATAPGPKCVPGSMHWPCTKQLPGPRGGREAAAARGQDGRQAGRSGVATGLQFCRRPVRGGGQGRVLAAQHRNRCCARPSRSWRRTTPLLLKQAAPAQPPGKGGRAGGRGGFADDPAWPSAASRRRRTPSAAL